MSNVRFAADVRPRSRLIDHFPEAADVCVTHNGYQWTSISVYTNEELQEIYRCIGRYLDVTET
jgi:hypothetical protein